MKPVTVNYENNKKRTTETLYVHECLYNGYKIETQIRKLQCIVVPYKMRVIKLVLFRIFYLETTTYHVRQPVTTVWQRKLDILLCCTDLVEFFIVFLKFTRVKNDKNCLKYLFVFSSYRKPKYFLLHSKWFYINK